MCARVYLYLGIARRVSLTLKKYIPYIVIWKEGKGQEE